MLLTPQDDQLRREPYIENLQALDDGVEPEIELISIDRGPGIVDVDRSLRDGGLDEIWNGLHGTHIKVVDAMSGSGQNAAIPTLQDSFVYPSVKLVSR